MTAIMNESDVAEALAHMADAICHDLQDQTKLMIVGVATGGVHLAKRLQEEIKERTGALAPCGSVDITLYRDDLFEGLTKPVVGTTRLPESIEGKEVLLVDDVLFTGRTVRSALVELMDYGRPRRIRLAVLIDRGHREIPIQPDYVGRVLSTSRSETVEVNLREMGSREDHVASVRWSA